MKKKEKTTSKTDFIAVAAGAAAAVPAFVATKHAIMWATSFIAMPTVLGLAAAFVAYVYAHGYASEWRQEKAPKP